MKAGLRAIQFRGATLTEATFENADLRPRSILSLGSEDSAVDPSGTNTEGKHFDLARMYQANFQKAPLARANFREAKLLTADIRDGDLGGANLALAQFKGADLVSANLDGANLF